MKRLLVVLLALFGCGLRSPTRRSRPEDRAALEHDAHRPGGGAVPAPLHVRHAVLRGRVQAAAHALPARGGAAAQRHQAASPSTPARCRRSLPAGTRARIAEGGVPHRLGGGRAGALLAAHPALGLPGRGGRAAGAAGWCWCCRRSLKTTRGRSARSWSATWPRRTRPPQLATFQRAACSEAIRQKKVLEDMPAEALEMSWGYPESIRRTLEGSSAHRGVDVPGRPAPGVPHRRAGSSAWSEGTARSAARQP